MNSIEDIYNKFKTFKVDVCGRSEKTIDEYIGIYRKYCELMSIKTVNDFINAKAQTVRDWLELLTKTKKNSIATKNKKLSYLKEIYKFLEYQEHCDIDKDILSMTYAKVPIRESKYTTKEEMISLLYVTTNLRVRSCMKVIMSTGLRFKEMMQLTCSDIEKGYAYVIGKGNKERKVSFPPSCIQECNRYINKSRARIVKKYGVKTDLLFLSDEGNPYNLQSFDASLKYYAEKAGIEWYGQMSAHKLRHGFITDKLEQGYPIHTVSSAVGHSNIATTNRYAHANQNAIDKMFMEE